VIKIFLLTVLLLFHVVIIGIWLTERKSKRMIEKFLNNVTTSGKGEIITPGFIKETRKEYQV